MTKIFAAPADAVVQVGEGRVGVRVAKGTAALPRVREVVRLDSEASRRLVVGKSGVAD